MPVHYRIFGVISFFGVFILFAALSGCKEMERARASQDASYHLMESLTQQGYIWHLDHVRREHARRIIEDAIYNACERSK